MQRETCKKQTFPEVSCIGDRQLKTFADIKNSRKGATHGSLDLLLEFTFDPSDSVVHKRSESSFTITGEARGEQDFVIKHGNGSFSHQTQTPDIFR